MSSPLRILSGILVIRAESCCLAEDGRLPVKETPLFLDSLPTGAGWFEGFSAATAHFTARLGKRTGDWVSFRGTQFGSSESDVILVHDSRLEVKASSAKRAS